MTCHSDSTPASFDKGAVLLLCLILLAALTMLGLAAASDQILQARMSVNLLKSSHAQQSSLSALRWGEDWLFGLDGLSRPQACADSCTGAEVIRQQGAYGRGIAHRDLGWWQRNTYAVGTDPVTAAILNEALAGQNLSGYWLIEELHVEPALSPDYHLEEIAYYKITSRGAVSGGKSFSITESIVARPWGDASLTNSFPEEISARGFCLAEDLQTPCGRLAWRKLH